MTTDSDFVGMGAASDISLSKLMLTGASASVAEGVTFPVDATKTRLQLQGELPAGRHPPTDAGGFQRASTPQPRNPTTHRSALGMGVHILQTEGVRGLYRGLAPGVVRHCIYSSSRICLYESFRHRWSVDGDQLPLHRRAAAGGTAGLIGQALASPADLVKVRMQADGRNVVHGLPPRYTGMVHALRSIVAENGLRGLYSGVAPNLTRAVLVNIGELAAYDSAKQHLLLQGWSEGVHTHTASAIMSGLISTILSCPADVIKSRIMAGGGNASAAYSGMLDCLVKTVKHEGVTALWKGFFPCWARLGPWQFTFWVSPTPALVLNVRAMGNAGVLTCMAVHSDAGHLRKAAVACWDGRLLRGPQRRAAHERVLRITARDERWCAEAGERWVRK